MNLPSAIQTEWWLQSGIGREATFTKKQGIWQQENYKMNP